MFKISCEKGCQTPGFIHVEALTLIFNGVAIFVLIYIITVFMRYATIKDIRFKRMEKLKMQNIRRK